MIKKYGWLPSLPSHRDYHIAIPTVKAVGLPTSCDQSKFVAWINDQGDLGSCTAQAAQSLIGFMQQLAFGKTTKGSRLFIYAVTRRLMSGRWKTGDTGADLRNVLGALVMQGVPPESEMPYDIAKFDQPIDPFLYSMADDFRAMKYFRHDTKGKTPEQVLHSIKTQIAGRIPTIFGFTCFTSIDDVGSNGEIPFPKPNERVDGGHAVLCVGYDDNLDIGNSDGALLIQNSWGKSWGDGGFGWLPYDYVLQGLASDFWSVSQVSWIDTGNFGF